MCAACPSCLKRIRNRASSRHASVGAWQLSRNCASLACGKLFRASRLPRTGNLREINRHLGYYCPECLQLAGSPTATSKPTEVPQTAEAILPREPAPLLPEILVIEDKTPDGATAAAAATASVPEDGLTAQDLAVLKAIEQAYASRMQNKRAATLDLTEEPVNKKVELCNSTPDKAEQPVGRYAATQAAAAAAGGDSSADIAA